MRFAVAGGVAAVVDVTATWVLQIGLEVLGALESRTVGWVLGTVLAYVINRRWTFRARPSTRRFGATMGAYLATYVMNIAIYRAVSNPLESVMDDSAALACAFALSQASATLANFLIQRFLVFRNS